MSEGPSNASVLLESIRDRTITDDKLQRLFNRKIDYGIYEPKAFLHVLSSMFSNTWPCYACVCLHFTDIRHRFSSAGGKWGITRNNIWSKVGTSDNYKQADDYTELLPPRPCWKSCYHWKGKYKHAKAWIGNSGQKLYWVELHALLGRAKAKGNLGMHPVYYDIDDFFSLATAKSPWKTQTTIRYLENTSSEMSYSIREENTIEITPHKVETDLRFRTRYKTRRHIWEWNQDPISDMLNHLIDPSLVGGQISPVKQWEPVSNDKWTSHSSICTTCGTEGWVGIKRKPNGRILAKVLRFVNLGDMKDPDDPIWTKIASPPASGTHNTDVKPYPNGLMMIDWSRYLAAGERGDCRNELDMSDSKSSIDGLTIVDDGDTGIQSTTASKGDFLLL